MSDQLTLPLCQRWRSKRHSYRPAGEPINPARYGVDLIRERDARAFVENHHYSGTFPAARLRVGLMRTTGTAHVLVGVAVFSVSAQPKAIPRWTGVPQRHGVELGRFVLLDDVPANGETWFLARAFRALQSELPDIRAVLSYSDPQRRVALDGTVVMPGHLGIIYRAHNGRHVGRSSPRNLYLGPDGRAISHRALSKIRLDERGADYAERQLHELGAPRRHPRESGTAYVRRVLSWPGFRKVRHPGNLAYVWAFDNLTKKGLPPSVPYPT